MKQFSFNSRKPGKILFKIFGLFFIILAVVGIYGFLTFKTLSGKGKILIASAKELKQAFAQNDIDVVSNKLNDFSDKYKDFENSAKSVYWASFIPYVADFKNGVEAGSYLVKAGQESIKAVSPYADLIGFKKGQASFVEKSAQDRLEN